MRPHELAAGPCYAGAVLYGVKVVVVVPAFDEAPRLGRVLLGLDECVDHVVVVDDASGDGTRQAALAVGDRRVEVVSHPRNLGVGAAITSGYLRAQALAPERRSTFVVMAGDGQMDPRDLPALVEPIARGRADYVKGNRFAWQSGQKRTAMPLGRWLGGWGFSLLTSAAIGQRVRDTQCGFTALACEASLALDLPGLWPGYGYPNDLLGQLAARRLRITEVPVRPIYADEVSRLRLRHLPRIVSLVGRAYVRRVRGQTLS